MHLHQNKCICCFRGVGLNSAFYFLKIYANKIHSYRFTPTLFVCSYYSTSRDKSNGSIKFLPVRSGGMEHIPMMNCKVSVNKVVIESELSYKSQPVLHYKIEYPQFTGTFFQRMLSEMNIFYKAKALSYQQCCIQQLYYEAIKQFDEAQANGFPTIMHEAFVTYEVTYNDDCVISLYFDQYEFRGGAHGNTKRYSDTWNIQKCCCMLLMDFFAASVNYRAFIIQVIKNQIAEQINNGNNIYFEDYEKLVVQYFHERNFYVTMDGVVIYYQQYEIAPYASGIPVFTIPYSEGTVLRPMCQ